MTGEVKGPMPWDEAETAKIVDAAKLAGLGEPATRAYAHIVAETAAFRHAQKAPLWREVRRLAWAVFALLCWGVAVLSILLFRALW